jgi:hypothetical protein
MHSWRLDFVITGIILVVLMMTGCFTLSIHPLYFEKDLIFNPELVGIWAPEKAGEEASETWTFLPAAEKAYRLVVKEENGHEGFFEVHMLRLGKEIFLDFFPEEPEGTNEFFLSHVIPAHSFMRISLEGHVLRMAFMDYSWLEEKIEAGKIQIKHETRDNMIVLTASTQALQDFVQKHLNEAFVFEEDVLYQR